MSMVVAFMGTPCFAVPSLAAVLSSGHAVPCVFTQPDRPRTRGRRLLPTPVKALAEERGIPVFSPKTLKDGTALDVLKRVDADVIVVVAYGLMIPREILSLPRLGCINVHASLLPRFRGAAPIERAIMQGETVTGVTTMYIAEGWDTGDMILQEEVAIPEDMTAGELAAKLSMTGAELLVKTLELLETGSAPRVPQDESLATYAQKLRPSEFAVDWNQTSVSIHNLVRAGDPKPGGLTRIGEKKLKVFRGVPLAVPPDGFSVADGPPGTVSAVVPARGILVKTRDGYYLVEELQAEGGRRLAAADYLRGNPIEPGIVLG